MRQERELSHDREMRDLQELRDVFDTAAEAVATASLAVTRFHSASQTRRPNNADDQAEAERLHGELFDALQRASDQQDRIALRVGREHEVYKSYAQAVAWIDQAIKVSVSPDAMVDRVGATAEVVQRLDVVTTQRKAFTEGGRKLIGTALSHRSDSAQTVGTVSRAARAIPSAISGQT